MNRICPACGATAGRDRDSWTTIAGGLRHPDGRVVTIASCPDCAARHQAQTAPPRDLLSRLRRWWAR